MFELAYRTKKKKKNLNSTLKQQQTAPYLEDYD